MATGHIDGTPSNVLLIHTHDLGQYLGCYGIDIDTPEIDAIAESGVRFENAVCTAPQCSPSRGSLMTGMYPHNNGLMGLAHLGWELDPGTETLPMLLRDAGYTTFLFGVQHETSYPDRLGYDHRETDVTRAENLGDKVASFLDDRSNESDDPFFASVGIDEPHRLGRERAFGFAAPRYDAEDPDDVSPPPYLPDQSSVREEIAGFRGMVRAVDECVGRICDRLDSTGLAEETLVIFTTDHGIAFPRAKGMLYEAGIETALLMRHPQFPAGAVREELISNIDILPTILEYVGARPPEGIDGRSFAPLLRDEAYERREQVFLEETFHDKYNPVRGIRTEQYKYIRNVGSLPLVYLPLDILHSKSGRNLYERYYLEERPTEELYDLDADPLEETNLIDDPAHQEMAERLREQLDDWLQRTDDPVLDGDIPVPPVHMEKLKKYPWV